MEDTGTTNTIETNWVNFLGNYKVGKPIEDGALQVFPLHQRASTENGKANPGAALGITPGTGASTEGTAGERPWKLAEELLADGSATVDGKKIVGRKRVKVDASADEVRSALEAALFSSIEVSKTLISSGHQFLVTFVADPGDISDLTCDVSESTGLVRDDRTLPSPFCQVDEVVKATSVASGGAFRLSFEGKVTAPLSATSTSLQIQQALERRQRCHLRDVSVVLVEVRQPLDHFLHIPTFFCLLTGNSGRCRPDACLMSESQASARTNTAHASKHSGTSVREGNCWTRSVRYLPLLLYTYQ